MKASKAIGLSLLCALLFSAFAASSAMATPGTTGVTCTQTGTPISGTNKFEDEHCTKVNNVTGKWFHEEIPEGEKKGFATNANTGSETKSAVVGTLRGKVFGTTLTLSATGIEGEGTGSNEKGPPMKAKGTGTSRFTGVQVTSLPKCKVKNEEVIAEANLRSATNEAGEMWTEAEGKKAEETFAEFTLEGAECSLKGSVLRVRGTAIGTPNGATIEYKEKEPKNTLRIGTEKAGTTEVIAVATARLGKEGSPLAGTTTAS